MPENWQIRLLVVGSQAQVRQYQQSHWAKTLGARHGELLENSPGRFACQFEAKASLLERLRHLSRRWPKLTFLIDYEVEENRVKGLAKAKVGALEQCAIRY